MIEGPSGLQLAIAAEVREATPAGLRVSEYLNSVSAAQLALLAVGKAVRRVTPYGSGRDQEIALLQADSSLREEVLPAVLGAPSASSWTSGLDVDMQSLIMAESGPPSSDLFVDDFRPCSGLLTTPVGGVSTSTVLPGLASVWLTSEPLDSGTLPSSASVWSVRPRLGHAIRCYEIHSRQDWIALCEAFPEDSTSTYEQYLGCAELHWREPFLTPQWAGVREVFDAVHLQWSGFIDASYEVLPVLNGTTALCWGSEGTIWLRWVFDEWHELDVEDGKRQVLMTRAK